MKSTYYGIEIELTGITRELAAKTIAKHFETAHTHSGGPYDKYEVEDQYGRVWKIVKDNSIVCTDNDYAVEIVSPKLLYKDIENLQELIRRIREAGGTTNSSTGIHIHLDGIDHTPKTVRNFLNIAYSKEELIFKALAVHSSRRGYCKTISTNFIERLNKAKPKTIQALADIWYKEFDSSEPRHKHYHSSRYNFINLHSFFEKGTIEVRAANSTLHAGKIKAYIQFCLAVNQQAMTQKCASSKRSQTANEKYGLRTWLLRLNLIGDEFKTCRKHLMENLAGSASFRNVS